MTQLKRSLGAVDAAALVVGCVIGAGIFRTAASIAGLLHSPGQIMAVWLAGGIISFCGALCYAELGAAYPKTGGDFVYLTRAYGPGAGFLFGWTKIFTERIGTIAILGFVFAEYLGFLFPWGPVGTKGVASAAILLLTLANVAGIQVGKEVQNIFTVLKIAALLAIIGAGLAIGPSPLSAKILYPQAVDGAALRAFGVALVFVLWTYGGWTESSYVAEEIRNPERDLPRSILGGLTVVTGLYLAVNWVYLTQIPISEMPAKPLVAAEVMRLAVGPVGGAVTAVAVAASAFGALNGYILTSGRILLAMGREFPLYSRLAAVHPRYATPARAMVFNGLLAVALVGWGTFDQIVTYSTVAISSFFAMAAFAVIVLRVRDPKTPRPYRVWGYPVTPLLFVAAILAFIVNIIFMQPKETLVGLGLAALGIPLYFWSQTRKDRRGLTPFLKKPFEAKGVRPLLVFALLSLSASLTVSPVFSAEDPLADQRQEMVSVQIEGRGVRDPKVLRAMRKVPRHEFVPASVRGLAYLDGPLPIGEGQTISQPYIVALMTELAGVAAGERVLEIGTGSGYQAAVLAELTDQVYTIEILPGLAARARVALDRLGYGQVKTRVGDGYLGWPEAAPFDAILVTAAPDHIPKPLIEQLAEGGVMVIPVGPEGMLQELQRLRKRKGAISTEKVIPVTFVPLIRESEKVQ